MAITRTLTAALRSAPIEPEDAGSVALAREYAKQIDASPDLLWKLGPLLLSVLVELRMTPKARAAVVKGGAASDKPASKLDELRARRARTD